MDLAIILNWTNLVKYTELWDQAENASYLCIFMIILKRKIVEIHAGSQAMTWGKTCREMVPQRCLSSCRFHHRPMQLFFSLPTELELGVKTLPSGAGRDPTCKYQWALTNWRIGVSPTPTLLVATLVDSCHGFVLEQRYLAGRQLGHYLDNKEEPRFKSACTDASASTQTDAREIVNTQGSLQGEFQSSHTLQGEYARSFSHTQSKWLPTIFFPSEK